MSTADFARTSSRRIRSLIFAAALAFTLSLAGSALKSTVQVYFSSIAGSMHVGIGAFAWSTTSFAIAIAIASPVVGVLADRFGGAAVLVAGTALAGAAFLLCAIAPSVLVFAPTYGIVGALSFTMLSYVPLGKLADELFAGRGEGLAYAAMTNGPAVGFIVLVPLWVWVGTMVSWRVVFTVAGAVMLTLLTPLALQIRRLSTDDPDAGPIVTTDFQLTFRQRLASAVSNRSFVILAIAFGGCGVTMAFVDVHFVADMNMAGMRPAVVSGSLASLGALEIVGSLVAGRMCDRGLIKQTLMIGYAMRGTAMLLFAFTPTTATALGFGVIFGVSYMVTVVSTSLWVARLMPPGSRATAMGLVWTVHSIGAAASSQLGAYAAQSFHSYTRVSLVEAIVVFGSFFLVAGITVPSARTKTQAVHPDPGEPCALAAAPKRPIPMLRRSGAKGRHRVGVAGHAVVGEVPTHQAGQPLPLHRDGLVPTTLERGVDLAQLGPHPLRDGDAPIPLPMVATTPNVDDLAL
jgi:predicted MFS family arabinose efflux permease